MKKCTECNGRMKELIAKTPERIGYLYYKCEKCGEVKRNKVFPEDDFDELLKVAKSKKPE